MLFYFECHGKEPLLFPQYRDIPQVETAGMIKASLFWWVNPIIMRGAKTDIHIEGLPGMNSELLSSILRRKILTTWDQRSLST
jgi:ATP-binding cassette subfamily C (CFTR/MRP) protein 1